MSLVFKAFGVDFVDVLGARRPRRKPVARGHDFEAADGSVVARRVGELRRDRVPAQLDSRHGGGRELSQPRLLFGGRGRIDPGIERRPEFGGEFR